MKKNLLIIALCVLGLFSCNNKKDFTVTVNLQNADGKMVYLQKTIDSKAITIDSVAIQNNTAKLVAPVADPSIYYSVKIDGVRYPIGFFSENNDMKINGDIEKMDEVEKIGSKAQDILNQYNAKINEYNNQFKDYYKLIQEADTKGDTALLSQLYEQYENIDAEMNKFTKDFILENKDNFVSHYVLYRNHWSYELEELEEFVNNFNKDVKSEFLTMINDYVTVLQRVAIGKEYIDFTMETPYGTMMSLSELVGKSKLLLVDFWASWCGPCRGENPNVVAVFNDFHDKGFNVFGVSLDQNKDKWIKAINDDGLTWNHVSDLKYWNNEAAKLYGVSSIPSNLLLDENGIIIAKNLRGDDLRKEVEKRLTSNEQ